jgi:hypothetical protein
MGKYPSTSVIEAALSVMEAEETEIRHSQSSNLADPTMPDLSTIQIDESALPVRTEPVNKPKPKAVKKSRSTSQNEKLEEVARSLIAIGQQLLETVTAGATTCGSIGMNMANTQEPKSKKKKGKTKKRLRKLSNGYIEALKTA